MDNKDKQSVWLVSEDSFRNILYILLSGKGSKLLKAGLKGNISIDEVNLLQQPFNKTFQYIPRLDTIPDNIRVKDLVCFFVKSNIRFGKQKKQIRDILNQPEIKSIAGKYFGALSSREKFEAILALTYTGNNDIYLIDDIAVGLPAEYSVKLKDRMMELKEEGALPVYLTTTEIVTVSEKKNSWFDQWDSWEYQMEGNRLLLQKRDKIGMSA